MRIVPLLGLLACAPHIPAPAALTAVDNSTPNPDLRVCWVEFAQGELPHGMVVAHNALDEDLTSTASGLVIVHPSGTWLVDGGLAADVPAELAEVRFGRRLLLGQATKGWTGLLNPADALRDIGVDPATLSGSIPTHGHFDHLGGLLSLSAPIWMPQAEIDSATAALDSRDGTVFPAEARQLLPRVKTLEFDDKPFLYWNSSRDLFGDGSVMIVPLPGHTPGSVGVFVRTARGGSVLLVGDTVWVREGYEQREPKSWIAGNFDADSDANNDQIAKLWALHQARPDIRILPAHDRRVWQEVFGVPGCR